MNLQLGGLANLIIGIATAGLGGAIVEGKFDFRYQWRNSEVSATAWRNLRKEGYKHYSV